MPWVRTAPSVARHVYVTLTALTLLVSSCDSDPRRAGEPTSPAWYVKFRTQNVGSESDQPHMVRIFLRYRDGKPSELYSSTVSGSDAQLLTEVMWNAKRPTIQVIRDWTSCSVERIPLVSGELPTKRNVLSQILGPLEKPKSARQIAPSPEVWEFYDGPARVRVIDHSGHYLDRIVKVGTRSGFSTMNSGVRIGEVATIPGKSDWDDCPE